MPDFDGDSDLAWLACAITQREKITDVERWFTVMSSQPIPRRKRAQRFRYDYIVECLGVS